MRAATVGVLIARNRTMSTKSDYTFSYGRGRGRSHSSIWLHTRTLSRKAINILRDKES